MTTSTVFLPKTNFNNGGINWFNDNQLLRGGGQAMQAITLGTDVDQLIEKIEELTWYSGVVDWHIKEDFAKAGEREYFLQELKMELEDDTVISTDANEELSEDMTRVLNMFLVDSIINIEFHGKNVIKLFLKGGNITIKGICA